MSAVSIPLHKWTREDYYRMAEKKILLPHMRVQLIDGDIIEMSPQRSLHSTSINLTEEVLRPMLPANHFIRIQLPLALSPHSEPEPDIAVVAGQPRDYRDEHPTTALLIVEVSDSTLLFDRNQKKKLYARCRIPEYWILNLLARVLEVYRKPSKQTYQSKTVLSADDTLSPLFHPEALVKVSDLLP